MYFFGTFEHSIDERGRLAIPARFRRAFVDGGVLRSGPEGCVEMYTTATFEAEVQRRLGSQEGNRKQRARRIRRSFLPGAYDVELDRQGRVLIPQQLRDGESATNQAVLVGCGDYLEIWRPGAWAGELARVEAEHNDEDDE
jgi:MraZ protein